MTAKENQSSLSAEMPSGAGFPRPLSPHLQVYRPQISSVLSILNRITGIALSFGTVLFVAWLWVAAYRPDHLETLHDFLGSVIGRLLLLGWSVAFYYHLANGVRHLFWDIGKGFELRDMTRSGIAVIVFTLAATALTWAIALNFI